MHACVRTPALLQFMLRVRKGRGGEKKKISTPKLKELNAYVLQVSLNSLKGKAKLSGFSNPTRVCNFLTSQSLLLSSSCSLQSTLPLIKLLSFIFFMEWGSGQNWKCSGAIFPGSVPEELHAREKIPVRGQYGFMQGMSHASCMTTKPQKDFQL